MVKSSGKSTISNSATRPGSVSAQPKRRSFRSRRSRESASAIGSAGGDDAGPLPAGLVSLFLQSRFLRQLVELPGGEVERLLGVLLSGDGQVQLAAQHLDEFYRVGEGRELLRRRH